MSEFVLRVASKRQVTFPDELLSALQLKQGDEFGIEFVTPTDIRLVPYTRIRKALMTPEIQEALRRSEASFNSPEAKLISLEEVEKRISAKGRGAKKVAVRSKLRPRSVSVEFGRTAIRAKANKTERRAC
jgi:bifunctional DNA-binding transcriptional regulator/antitoxin component of YhaV-PrlF toxin-antitoxin module